MGFTDWIKSAADAVSGVADTIDRYTNPFYHQGPQSPLDQLRTGSLTYSAKQQQDTGAIQGGLENTMSALKWFRDNAVSQPLSTALLMAKQARTSNNDPIGLSTRWFNTNDWAKSWDAANHISPFQAAFLNKTEAEQAINSPLQYYKPAEASLPPGFSDLPQDQQQEMLRKAGMPATGNQFIEKYRQDHAWYKFATGVGDFALSWEADPTVLGGKAIGAVRAAKIVRAAPAGGRTAESIDKLMQESLMNKAKQFLWDNKDNPQLVNNLSMARKSALGPRLGGILSTLQSPTEVDDFLRIGLGDAAARARLEADNKVAANRLQKDTARLPELDLQLQKVYDQGNTQAAVMIQQRINQINAQIQADEPLVARYTAMLDHYNELDQINLTRWSFARAQSRTMAQNSYSAGAGRTSALSSARKGLGFSRVYSDFFGTPLTVVRSFKELHPNGHVRIDDLDQDSVNELRGQIARIPNIGPNIRADLLNRYLKTTSEGERLDMLDEIGTLGVTQIARKHGFTRDEGLELFKTHQTKQADQVDALRRYSAGWLPGNRIHVDEFPSAGGKLAVHANLVTRLANDHVLQDLDALDTTLARHGSSIKALRVAGGSAKDLIENSSDFLNHLWKFGTLFRLGYIPRVLGDDIGGQVARLGTAAMGLRAGYGTKNLATNLAAWKPASFYDARIATQQEGVKFADDEIALLKPKADALRAKVNQRTASDQADLIRARDRHRRAVNKLNALDPNASPVRVAATQKLVANHAASVDLAERRLASGSPGKQAQLAQWDDQLTHLNSGRDDALKSIADAKLAQKRGFRQSSQMYDQPEVAPGVVLPPSTGGERGEYYAKMFSSDESLDNIFRSNKQLVHGHLMRSYSHSGVSVSYPQNPKLFVEAWDKAINHQIMQDDLGKLAVKGATPEEMTQWLSNTAAGRAYRRRLGLAHATNEDIANSVYYDIEEYLPTPQIRDAALKGETDAEYLKAAAEAGMRPAEVHSTQLAENMLAGGQFKGSMDRIINYWFRTVSSLPADRMSRHPLFNQLYEGYGRQLAQQEMLQGVKVTQKDADRIAETARRLALNSARKLVFDIAHRSDAAHALRFTSPFYSATTEAWQRWARIIADRPQTVGYANVFFNSPLSMGITVDMDGNKIMPDGTVIDPVTGKRVMVPKGERKILLRVPTFIANGPVGKALGMDSSGNWSISQDSMNLVTQGDPWFNPGTGPMVQIAVNNLVKDKPSQAEVARHLGVLPYGPTAGGVWQQFKAFALPSTIKNFLTAYDTSDERYQQVKLQIMQRAAYEHANLGKPMPSAKEIADMTRNYWLFSTSSAFLQPFATSKPDKYQFYRDQYNALRRMNPQTADQAFLDRFHESFFVFAQGNSSSGAGIPATKKAVELTQKYGDLIAKNPELAALIVGPEGKGPFSPEAYTYQLSTPLTPGGAEMQRTKMSADDAMKENQKRLGWQHYTQAMNYLGAELGKRGLKSFTDPGAKDLNDMKRAFAHLYGDATLPDGSPNPYYNEQWSKDFYSFDTHKYDRLIPSLTAVAYSPLAQESSRSDLRVLQQYLAMRQLVLQELVARKAAGGNSTLSATSNADLRSGWVRVVDHLTQSNTSFHDLQTRYLSRDLGVDAATEAQL